MPTPRSESIIKARKGETDIREPKSKYDNENKIDHYAVLSQVINAGIDTYLSNPDYHSPLLQAASHNELERALRSDIGDVILATLKDAAFTAHHESLVQSQSQRHQQHSGRHRDIEGSIMAGATTFTNTFTYIHKALSRLGPEVAAHPDNWELADRIAKLNITSSYAYYSTYLATYENWPEFMNHTEVFNDGSVKFLPGYPGDAFVTEAVATNRRMLETKHFDVRGDEPLVAVKDIELSEDTIGCPVTFHPGTIKKLWAVYAEQAYRIDTTPAISNADDTEAFDR